MLFCAMTMIFQSIEHLAIIWLQKTLGTSSIDYFYGAFIQMRLKTNFTFLVWNRCIEIDFITETEIKLFYFAEYLNKK